MSMKRHIKRNLDPRAHRRAHPRTFNWTEDCDRLVTEICRVTDKTRDEARAIVVDDFRRAGFIPVFPEPEKAAS